MNKQQLKHVLHRYMFKTVIDRAMLVKMQFLRLIRKQKKMSKTKELNERPRQCSRIDEQRNEKQIQDNNRLLNNATMPGKKTTCYSLKKQT